MKNRTPLLSSQIKGLSWTNEENKLNYAWDNNDQEPKFQVN